MKANSEPQGLNPMGDPLSCVVEEANNGAAQELQRALSTFEIVKFSVQLEGLRLLLLLLQRSPATFAKDIGEILERAYSKDPLVAQACLLLAYFHHDARVQPVALAYLERWFVDCDLQADRIGFEYYLGASKEGVPDFWPFLHSAQIKLDALGASFEGATQFRPTLARWRNCEPRTVRELVEAEKKRTAEKEQRQREAREAQEERKQQAERRKAEEDQIKSARAVAGACILCGNALGGFRKTFGAKKHPGCTVFTS